MLEEALRTQLSSKRPNVTEKLTMRDWYVIATNCGPLLFLNLGSFRRAEKLTENDVFQKTEGLLYAPGIADKCKYKFFIRNLKLKF